MFCVEEFKISLFCESNILSKFSQGNNKLGM